MRNFHSLIIMRGSYKKTHEYLLCQTIFYFTRTRLFAFREDARERNNVIVSCY